MNFMWTLKVVFGLERFEEFLMTVSLLDFVIKSSSFFVFANCFPKRFALSLPVCQTSHNRTDFPLAGKKS